MSFIKTTEQDSNYNHLEKMSITEVLTNINKEDKTVAFAIEKGIPTNRTTHQSDRSSTSKRRTIVLYWCWNKWPIGILDASECPQHLVFHQI